MEFCKLATNTAIGATISVLGSNLEEHERYGNLGYRNGIFLVEGTAVQFVRSLDFSMSIVMSTG